MTTTNSQPIAVSPQQDVNPGAGGASPTLVVVAPRPRSASSAQQPPTSPSTTSPVAPQTAAPMPDYRQVEPGVKVPQMQKSRIAGWSGGEGAKESAMSPKEGPAEKPPQTPEKQEKGKKGGGQQQQRKQQAEKKQAAGGGEKAAPKKEEEKKGERKVKAAAAKAAIEEAKAKAKARDVMPLFAHLPQFEPFHGDIRAVHPSIAKIGLGMSDMTILGSNARCVAMLEAFKDVIGDAGTVAATAAAGGVAPGLLRDLDVALKQAVQFLVDSRPISIGMGSAINYVKHHISRARESLQDDEEIRDYLCEKIDEFIQQRIVVADEEIIKMAATKVSDGETIVTHGASHVVEQVFAAAFAQGKRFRVAVVDSRPLCEGRELVRRLSARGIRCTYSLLSGLSYLLQGATKVFLGAHAMLSNGSLLSRAGTAIVASSARYARVPVIVCCESYKFTDKVQLDSICFNQLGDPLVIAHPQVLAYRSEFDAQQPGQQQQQQQQQQQPNPAAASSSAGVAPPQRLKLLNVMYDVTPIECIAMVVTEFGMIPPTSVPVIIREFRGDQVSSFV